MAIAYGSTGTLLNVTTAATTFNVAYPSGITAGDLLVLHVVTNGGAPSSTPPTGWTEVFRESVTVSNPRGGVWIKVASGSETGTLAVTVASTTGVASISRFTGVDTTTPQAATASTVEVTTTGDLTATLPSVTTAVANTMLVMLVAANSTSKQWTGPAGATERVDYTQTIGTSKSGSIYTEPVAASGITGTRDLSMTSPGVAHWGVMMALRPGSVGPLGTLVSRVVGIPTTPTTNARVTVKTTNTLSARLKLGTDTGLTTGVVFGSSAAPDADGYVTLTASGLTAGTQYYYRVEMTDVNSNSTLDSMSSVGKLKTAPSGQSSFAFDFGSCANSTDPIVFPLITARDDAFFFHLGDMFYNDGSGTTLANIKSKLEGKIAQANHADLYAHINMGHTPGDHDVATNDTNNATDPTAWGNWRTASAQLFPDPSLYYTFVWGRVRFIVLDLMNYASAPTATDDSSKSLLGTTQKTWLKDTITAATEPLIMIVQSDPWIGSAVANDAGWFGFTTERAELGAHFSASGKNIVIVAGDMHALAAHDGVSGSVGNVAVFNAGPFGQTASQKGGPYTVGPYPATGTAFVTHYGRVAITDSGTSIAAAFTGYDETNTARVTLTKTFTLTQDFSASANFSGSGTLSSSTTPAFSITSPFSGSGTLTASVVVGVARSAGLSGSGTLSSSATPGVPKAVAFSGSGTLVGSGMTPGVTVAGGLSGDGVVVGNQTAATASVTAPLSSTGTLSKAVIAGFTASMSQSGTGTLGLSVGSISMQALAQFTGSGTLSTTQSVAVTKSVSLSGSGTLSSARTPAVSITANLSGDGSLTAASSNSFTRTANLSGSGTLSGVATSVSLTRSAALSGSGTLTGGTVNNKAVSVNLTGSGALQGFNTSTGMNVGMSSSGSGTLSATTVVTRLAFPEFAGSGTLTATAKPDVMVEFNQASYGMLVVEFTAQRSVTAELVGVGLLIGDADDQKNYDVAGYLANNRWQGGLGSKRWKGKL